MTTTALNGLDIALSGPSQKRSRLRQLFDHMVAARQREANRRIAVLMPEFLDARHEAAGLGRDDFSSFDAGDRS